MAVRICLASVAILTLIAVSGCEPYETEITLNPNGSGVMTQKLTLSPLGAMVLKQMRVRNQDGPSTQIKLPTTEAEALKWNENHPDAGVRVESFISEPAGEARNIAFRVSFDSLEKLSVTEWGWPLDASASEKDGGTVLTINDPLRRVIQASLGSEIDGNSDEATALFDGGGMVTADARVRVVLNLPVAAKAVEGAELSADGKQVVYDAVPGGSLARFQEWVHTGPVTIQLPAAIADKPFATPRVPFAGAPQVAVVKEPEAMTVPVGEGMVELKDFEYRLTNVNYSRSLSFQNQQPEAEPARSENIGLSFQLYGPEGVEIFREYSGNSQTPGLDMLSALKDQDGNDLRGDGTNMNCYLQGGSWRNGDMDKAQYHGSLGISFAPKPGVTSLSLVEGYVVADVTLEKGTLEVEPIPANLNKVYEIGDATLEFTEFSLPRIRYRWTPATLGQSYPNRGAPAIVGRSADGTETRSSDRSISRDAKAWIISEALRPDLPAGGKLVITYAAKSAKVKLPFKLENVPLP